MSLRATISDGKCVFCNKMYSKQGISYHLDNELDRQVANLKKGNSYHVKIEPDMKYYGFNGFFLNLWIDGDTRIEDIDQYLRRIWFGYGNRYISAFKNSESVRDCTNVYSIMSIYDYLNKRQVKKYEKIMEEVFGQIPMAKKSKSVFFKDMVLEYEYSSVSPTLLTLQVMKEYPVKLEKKIFLLSGNEPVAFYCDECKMPPSVKLCQADVRNLCNRCRNSGNQRCAYFSDWPAMKNTELSCGTCSYNRIPGAIGRRQCLKYCE